MSDATLTTHAAITKRIYPENRVETAMYDNNPCYAMMPKKYDSKGEAWQRAIRHSPTSGRSATFGTARSNQAPSNVVRVLITPTQDYSLYSVNGMAIRMATGSGALVDIFSEELDAAMDAMNRSYGWGIYGNGGGAIGQLTSTASLVATSFTLNTIDDVVRFEKGMYLKLASTDGTTGTVKAGRLQVTAVDRDLATITVDQAISTGIPTAAVSDYIFADGDFGLKMKGLSAWVPSTAPGPGDSFFGLDRSVDPVRLAGVRVSGANMSIAEAVKKGLQQNYRNGGKTSHIFMNDKRFLELELEQGTQKRWIDTTIATIGFTGLEFVGYGGKPVEVYPDPNCPVNSVYGLNMPDWSVEGPNKFPFIENFDGLKSLRDTEADSFSGQIKSYHQGVCKAPGRQFVVSLV